MKRCPKCNRAYSDIAEKCPQCNISLSGNPGASAMQTNTTWSTQNTNQQNGTQPGQGYSQSPYNQMQGSQMQYDNNNYNNNNHNNNGGTGYIQQPASSMGFIEAVKTCFTKYATFTGRARRSEYWWFVLFYEIMYILLSVFSQSSEFMALVLVVWLLGVFLPGLAVCIRRLHDTGRDWKFVFWILVPIYGPIKLIIQLAKDSDPGSNAYGPCPK